MNGSAELVGVGEGIVAEGDPPASTARRSSSGVVLRPRVLVIDDEPLLGQTLQLGLEDSLDVELELTAGGGLNRLLAGESFQVVLCDLSLPDMSGSEVHASLERAKPELLPRFVIMTGGAVTTASREFLEAYEGPLLQKPFTLQEVEALARRLSSEDGE